MSTATNDDERVNTAYPKNINICYFHSTLSQFHVSSTEVIQKIIEFRWSTPLASLLMTAVFWLSMDSPLRFKDSYFRNSLLGFIDSVSLLLLCHVSQSWIIPPFRRFELDWSVQQNIVRRSFRIREKAHKILIRKSFHKHICRILSHEILSHFMPVQPSICDCMNASYVYK